MQYEILQVRKYVYIYIYLQSLYLSTGCVNSYFASYTYQWPELNWVNRKIELTPDLVLTLYFHQAEENMLY
jgi:hypothetical protein